MNFTKSNLIEDLNNNNISAFIDKLTIYINYTSSLIEDENKLFVSLIKIFKKYYTPANGFSYFIKHKDGYTSPKDNYLKEFNEKMENFSKTIIIKKKVKAYGFHGGFFSINSPVSIFDILKNTVVFIDEDLDHFRKINSIEIKKFDSESLTLDICVDNFST